MVLPGDLMALVLAHAGELRPVEWVGRAIRAYAKAPMTPAERQRARRERLKKAGGGA